LNGSEFTQEDLNGMKSPMLDEAACRAHADFCSVFANATRIKLFGALREREATVSELSDLLGISLQNASQHLRLMRDKGAVNRRKEGNRVYYLVANAKFVQGFQFIREAVIEEMGRRAKSVRLPRARSGSR
jgi:DNA-binding transcriptional ArsR family regulator